MSNRNVTERLFYDDNSVRLQMGERNLSNHGESQGFKSNQEVHSINSSNQLPGSGAPLGKTLMNNTM